VWDLEDARHVFTATPGELLEEAKRRAGPAVNSLGNDLDERD
jgi:hypothetical protein